MSNQTITPNPSPHALIICDVDEVVIHFLKPLRDFLYSLDLRLEANNFSLNDNIYSNSTNKLIGKNKVRQLLIQFYEKSTENLPIVEGAKSALTNIAKVANIVFLSNIPKQFQVQRQRNLNKHGLSYPLSINDGPKGPHATTLVTQTSNHVFFIDDNPSNLKSAREHIENVNLIQFVADEDFFKLSPSVNGVKLKTRNWRQVEQYINDVLLV